MEFLTGAPVWVWPLLAGLVFLGWQSTVERSTSVAMSAAVSLLGLLGLRTALGLPAGPMVMVGFLGGYGLGAYLGFQVQRRWILSRQGGQVRLAGEWLTMACLMVVYWANFLRGVVQAVAPQQLSSLMFVLPLVLVLGVCSGLFLGRALRVVRG